MRRLAVLTALALLLGIPSLSSAQGCSLCRDATAGSAPKARQGLRRGILVLGIPAGTIFAGILILALRILPAEEDALLEERPAPSAQALRASGSHFEP